MKRLLATAALLSLLLPLSFSLAATGPISKISVAISGTNATIYWLSTAPTPSLVYYGTSPGVSGLSKTAENPTPVSFHAVLLTNLSPGATYYFHIATQSSKSKEDFALYSSFKAGGTPAPVTSSPAPSGVPGSSGTGLLFTRTFSLGDTDPQIKLLQMFLNADPRTQVAVSGPGSKGQETSTFGPATKRALIKFQELYATEILKPVGLLSGTGTFGPATRFKLNQLAALASKPAVATAPTTAKPTVTAPSYGVGGGGGGGSSSFTPAPSYGGGGGGGSAPATPPVGSSIPAAPVTPPGGGSSSATPTPSPAPVVTAPVTPGAASSLSSVTQYGITWTFDKAYPVGQFVNGDYWVVGPVVITGITPDYGNGRNGWQINPVPGPQTLDVNGGDWDQSLVPTLPKTVPVNSSVVKVISLPVCQSSNHVCVDTAAVLTVLSSAPPADAFRPAYAGSAKTIYTKSQLQTQNLPSLQLTASAPSLDYIKQDFQMLQYEGPPIGWGLRVLHPLKNMPNRNYGADLAVANNNALLGLMGTDSPERKMPALINVVQAGIDLAGLVEEGIPFPPDGGHGQGRWALIAFAGKLLGSQKIIDTVKNAPRLSFAETGSIVISKTGMPLWGQPNWSSELSYWRVIHPVSYAQYGGAITQPDPYGYIDGGEVPTGGYQTCCVSPSIKDAALVMYLMGMSSLNAYSQEVLRYADRWVTFGMWTKPDPCAPHTGNMADYGIKFGPDGSGDCIKDTDPSDGIGRFPTMHGTNADGGSYGSVFADEMWRQYRGPLSAGTPTAIDAYPPTLSGGFPRSTLSVGTTQASLSLTTSEAATCRYSTIAGTRYGAMTGTFATTGGTTHFTVVSGLSNGGNYTYYVRCADASGNDTQSDFLISFSIGVPAPTGIGPTDGLVARYSFDQGDISGSSAIDTSGNSNTGVLINSPAVVAGKKGEALAFNGTNYVGLPQENFILTTGLTIGGWINVSDPSGSQIILTRGGTIGSNPNQAAWYLLFGGGSVQFVVSDGSAAKTAVSTSSLAPGTWHLVNGTFDGASISLYIDGVKEATVATGYATLNANPAYSKGGTAIGVDPNYGAAGYNGFKGNIDDVRIYNRALFVDEINALYQNGVTGAIDSGKRGFFANLFEQFIDGITRFLNRAR